jgi:hypothetical protein
MLDVGETACVCPVPRRVVSEEHAAFEPEYH